MSNSNKGDSSNNEQSELPVSQILDNIKEMIENLVVVIKEQKQVSDDKFTKTSDKMINIDERLSIIEEKLNSNSINNNNANVISIKNNHQNSTSINNFKLKELIPKFDDKLNSNPVEYIIALKKLIRNEKDTYLITNIIRASLSGNPLEWFSIIDGTFDNIDQFEEIFINRYWSEFVQNKVRMNLFNGKFNPKLSISREIYFTKKYSFAKHLAPERNRTQNLNYTGYRQQFPYNDSKGDYTYHNFPSEHNFQMHQRNRSQNYNNYTNQNKTNRTPAVRNGNVLEIDRKGAIENVQAVQNSNNQPVNSRYKTNKTSTTERHLNAIDIEIDNDNVNDSFL